MVTNEIKVVSALGKNVDIHRQVLDMLDGEEYSV